MSPLTLLLLALGVSADAFAVALAKGLQSRSRMLRDALLLATAFGVAQAAMPLLGWLLGSTFAELIAPFDHWIVFGLLAVVGGRMIWEAVTDGGESEDDHDRRLSIGSVLVLAVATSIDALAVGISLAFLDVSVWVAVVVIGITTFLLSFAAVFLGARIGTRFQQPAEIVGGVVLIVLGVQTLAEHLHWI
ncbi:manganese efflux pump MntP [Nakamurella leprariae]|uniref:Putative manganese efflux pump MntP n=1 Tax=Nakamurella leprariae TaxID=2803911 RepID=A0A938YIR3_9ACTN|nr:manganese efflux pump MntP family protein [Nakamurella leprariae]MBM9468530.1 manganese efflux pump [Nakamurella leprariae]